MTDYPSWVEYLSYLGLDPITVWMEYRFVLYAVLWLIFFLIVAAIYYFGIQLRFFIATYRYSFMDRLSLFKYLEEMPQKEQEACFQALDGERMIYGVPAISIQQVAGFDKAVGYVLVTANNLIFTSGGQKIVYKIESIVDANIRDGLKYVEFRIQTGDKRPVFHLLGISREQGQDIFMKIHALRQAIKDKQGKV